MRDCFVAVFKYRDGTHRDRLMNSRLHKIPHILFMAESEGQDIRTYEFYRLSSFNKFGRIRELKIKIDLDNYIDWRKYALTGGGVGR